jgi:hypothetical protein
VDTTLDLLDVALEPLSLDELDVLDGTSDDDTDMLLEELLVAITLELLTLDEVVDETIELLTLDEVVDETTELLSLDELDVLDGTSDEDTNPLLEELLVIVLLGIDELVDAGASEETELDD